MAGPSPGSLVSSGQSGSLHNVLFYVPQNGNGNQFANEACHNQHGGTLSHLSYMQTSHNRYRPDTGLNKVHCFPTDNPYSCDRDTNGSYWSYQQHQQQWNQWNQNDYNHSESFGFKSCWMQQQQQQQQSMQQRHSMQNNNPSCMGFNPQYNHMQQQQQHQQMQQQQQQQHMLQQSGYRNNVVATVTVQSTSQSLSRTPSRCDSVRSETCESHCSSSLSGGSGAMDDMTGQQYGMYQNFASVHPQQQQQHQQLQQQQYPQHEEHVQQQQQQCFWPSSHYDMQQDQQQQMDYFRQQQMQHQQQQQQQHYYRQHQVMQQQQQTNCYWPRDSSPVIQQQQTLPPQQHQQQSRQFACAEPVVMETPICSSSPIVADTTTISSPTSSPQYSSVDESMECAPVPPADDSMESSTEIPPATTTSPPPPDAATAPVISISVPVGWTRDVSGGSVIYISPSGCRLSSLEDVATYVQRDGTCKCGLPCPLRLQHVFNFDPSVPCNADETSLDAPTTCCHKQSLDATSDKSPQPSIKTASVKRKKSAHNKANKSPKILPEQPEQQQQQPLLFRRSPCPNVDVRQIPAEQNRPPAGSLLPSRPGSGPTFFEDPSAYLAQQTVLLQSSLQNGTASSSPSPQTEAITEPEQTQEELLGDLLDCIPDSMEEVLDRQKDVAAAAEAAAQAEKAANLIKQATATAPPPPPPVKQQQSKPPQKSPSVPVSLAPARSKPPPLAIRPATPATAAARSRAKAAETSSKSTKSRSPRRTHHQPIQSNAKVLQPAQPQPLIHQQQQQQFWPAISAPNIGPLRTTSFPFHSAPIFSSAAIRPGNLPMTFLTSQPQANGFNQSLPVLTTRPALAPSGQVVHVLTTPGPMLTAAPLAADPSTTVPILTVGPMTNHSNNNNNSRGLTRTGKKRKSTPQTVASILQQGAQLAAMTQQQPQQHPTTLTLSQEPLVAYNVQNFQQIQPQQTIQTLALMPDGKTYVVVNSQPAPAPQPAPQQNTGGHWLLSPRPANTQHPLIAPAGQPVNVFCTTQTPGTTFVLNGTSAPTTQVLQLQDGTLVHTTTTAEQPNLLANYGGLFIRCPTTPATGIFSTSPAVRTLPLPIPIAPGRSPGRSPDSSSIDGVTSSSANAETLVACGEATPPSQVRTAHPSPVVQSSQIDSCTVQEVEITDQDAANKKQAEFNNNVQHWLKPDPKQVAAG